MPKVPIYTERSRKRRRLRPRRRPRVPGVYETLPVQVSGDYFLLFPGVDDYVSFGIDDSAASAEDGFAFLPAVEADADADGLTLALGLTLGETDGETDALADPNAIGGVNT